MWLFALVIPTRVTKAKEIKMIEISKLKNMLRLEVSADGWFSKLSKKEQQAYVKAHPHSKFSKNKPGEYQPAKGVKLNSKQEFQDRLSHLHKQGADEEEDRKRSELDDYRPKEVHDFASVPLKKAGWKSSNKHLPNMRLGRGSDVHEGIQKTFEHPTKPGVRIHISAHPKDPKSSIITKSVNGKQSGPTWMGDRWDMRKFASQRANH
jgi:hypothetical protein